MSPAPQEGRTVRPCKCKPMLRVAENASRRVARLQHPVVDFRGIFVWSSKTVKRAGTARAAWRPPAAGRFDGSPGGTSTDAGNIGGGVSSSMPLGSSSRGGTGSNSGALSRALLLPLGSGGGCPEHEPDAPPSQAVVDCGAVASAIPSGLGTAELLLVVRARNVCAVDELAARGVLAITICPTPESEPVVERRSVGDFPLTDPGRCKVLGVLRPTEAGDALLVVRSSGAHPSTLVDGDTAWPKSPARDCVPHRLMGSTAVAPLPSRDSAGGVFSGTATTAIASRDAV
eukprot:CAMPEP_0117493492 /NCGR_PEP_ID=MMETSP0784-20121206/19125_1 /TAXON_ID=39447 /ORGANISM="" /LENGTH=286 /DNA_ID=CAMNT_0005288345 /DNA_START=122 /DNA_END=983 /DNA_ORIENTATION=-